MDFALLFPWTALLWEVVLCMALLVCAASVRWKEELCCCISIRRRPSFAQSFLCSMYLTLDAWAAGRGEILHTHTGSVLVGVTPRAWRRSTTSAGLHCKEPHVRPH